MLFGVCVVVCVCGCSFFVVLFFFVWMRGGGACTCYKVPAGQHNSNILHTMMYSTMIFIGSPNVHVQCTIKLDMSSKQWCLQSMQLIHWTSLKVSSSRYGVTNYSLD